MFQFIPTLLVSYAKKITVTYSVSEIHAGGWWEPPISPPKDFIYTSKLYILAPFKSSSLVSLLLRRPWLLPPDNRWRLPPLNGYCHRIGGNKATNWLLTPVGGTTSHELTDTEDGRWLDHVNATPLHVAKLDRQRLRHKILCLAPSRGRWVLFLVSV